MFNNIIILQKLNTSLEFIHIERKPQIVHCQKTELPSFLFAVMPKVEVVISK